jgi:hypothetical protein
MATKDAHLGQVFCTQLPDAALAGQQALPCSLDAYSQWRHKAQAGDHDAPDLLLGRDAEGVFNQRCVRSEKAALAYSSAHCAARPHDMMRRCANQLIAAADGTIERKLAHRCHSNSLGRLCVCWEEERK